MISTNLPTPARALAIGAHPDDIEFGCGGTLAKWADAGAEVFLLVCTDGSKGSWEADQDSAELVATRRREQRAAAQVLSSRAEVVFLDWPDGELESGLRQRLQIAAWIRSLKPNVVLGHDPWKRYRLHPDHRNAGWLTTDGIVAARDPLFFPELRAAPHRPELLLLFEADAVDHLEEVNDFFDRKIAALFEHKSQFRSTLHIDDLAAKEQVETFVEQERARLREHTGPGLALTEAFKLIADL